MKKLILLLLTLLTLVSCSRAPEQYETKSTGGITYKTVAGEELGLDILYPTNRIYKKNPTVLVLHGGGWISGERSDFLREFAPLCDELRASGVTVVAVSYRKALNGLSWRDCLDDCEDALTYMIDHADEYDVDTERISVAGYSAGAQLAMLTAIETGSQVKYCVSMSGPTCFTDSRESKYYSDALDYYNSMIFSGDDATDMYKASPIVRISRKCGSAFLLVSGGADNVITPEHAVSFCRETESFGLSAELIEVDELTHSYPAYSGFGELCYKIAHKIIDGLTD